jgi:hypothetical protein
MNAAAFAYGLRKGPRAGAARLALASVREPDLPPDPGSPVSGRGSRSGTRAMRTFLVGAIVRC